MGRTTRKDIFHHSQKLEPCRREIGTSSGTSEGSKPSGSPVGPTMVPTQSLDDLLSSPYPDMYPNPSLSLTITLMLVGHCYYFLKKIGRDLTSTSLKPYLKYSFDIEEGVSNFISIEQYGSPYNLPDLGQHESSYNLLNQWDHGGKPLLPQLFRKATAAKIINFLWIQSEYNLSYMLSQHRKLLKILQVIQKLLIL